jgi:ABC-type amino acid transport substrate-binding protein
MTVVQNPIATGLSLPHLQKEASVTSPKRLARIAGLLYLVVGIFGGFAVGYVSPMVYVPGDAAAAAGNVLANAGLVRIGVIADLLQATVFVFLGMTLYLLLRHVNRNIATAMVILVAIATTVMSLDKVFQFAALRVASDGAYAAAFGMAGSNALVLLLLDIHNYGFLIAQIFFGLWLAPLGYLAYKSGMFPRALGVVLVAAAVSYVVDVLVAFSSAGLAKQLHPFLIIAPAIGEIGMVVYLLVWGVRTRPAGGDGPRDVRVTNPS